MLIRTSSGNTSVGEVLGGGWWWLAGQRALTGVSLPTERASAAATHPPLPAPPPPRCRPPGPHRARLHPAVPPRRDLQLRRPAVPRAQPAPGGCARPAERPCLSACHASLPALPPLRHSARLLPRPLPCRTPNCPSNKCCLLWVPAPTCPHPCPPPPQSPPASGPSSLALCRERCQRQSGAGWEGRGGGPALPAGPQHARGGSEPPCQHPPLAGPCMLQPGRCEVRGPVRGHHVPL